MRHDGPVFGLGTAATNYTIAPAELGSWLEANGFESLWFGEHSHVPTGQKSLRPNYRETPAAYREIYDPFVSLMGVAAATTTLKLGTSILILTEHHPIRLAKAVATLDRMSGGRVILGVGAGWSAEEMADYGMEFSQRWKWVRECVLAIREIWNNDVSEFEGEMVKFEPMWCGPKPLQKNGPPILMGAWNPHAVPRIIEYCDGWIPVDQGEVMQKLMDDLRDACTASGKSFEELDHTVVIDPLANYVTADSDLEKRVDQLYGMGFRRFLFTFLQDTRENQWRALNRLERVVRAFS
ncbi:TIGR03619 family F420-dependent LLM class oxidoreductase [Rhizorhabdus argentea]|uniref:TIGR03619 family F420-dependent LLM class oxidoreductase n=1 Tax=Rhizorhabdus argentea TaxID=1387174 RepID=UPI0030EBD6EC